MKEEYLEEFPISPEWVTNAIHWANAHYPYVSYHHPNAYEYPEQGFRHVLHAGKKEVEWSALDSVKGTKAGIFGYDLKNQFERLSSDNPPLIATPDTVFFQPEVTIEFHGKSAIIHHQSAGELYTEIATFTPALPKKNIKTILPLTSQEEYIRHVKDIQNHIREGDIYELNYCIAFEAAYEELSPVALYLELERASPMPFSTFFKAKDLFLVGASPERFLKKTTQRLIAQPIKGTIKRGTNTEEDEQFKSLLKTSEKEMAENLMIVDLMRNDLAKVSRTGTVKVDELFGIYPFRQVFQMISTVSSELLPHIPFSEVIKATFPMGSMTGAPKIKCMELIEKYENFRRGWFSGAVGYISEDGDADFSVIIRSIILDVKAKKLFYAAGSAITFDADPAYEYSECLLKASAIEKVLTSTSA